MAMLNTVTRWYLIWVCSQINYTPPPQGKLAIFLIGKTMLHRQNEPTAKKRVVRWESLSSLFYRYKNHPNYQKWKTIKTMVWNYLKPLTSRRRKIWGSLKSPNNQQTTATFRSHKSPGWCNGPFFSVSALVSWLRWLRWLRWLGPDGGPKKSWITRRFLLICRDSHDGFW